LLYNQAYRGDRVGYTVGGTSFRQGKSGNSGAGAGRAQPRSSQPVERKETISTRDASNWKTRGVRKGNGGRKRAALEPG